MTHSPQAFTPLIPCLPCRHDRGEEGGVVDVVWGGVEENTGRHPTERRHQCLHRRRPQHCQEPDPQVSTRILLLLCCFFCCCVVFFVVVVMFLLRC